MSPQITEPLKQILEETKFMILMKAKVLDEIYRIYKLGAIWNDICNRTLE